MKGPCISRVLLVELVGFLVEGTPLLEGCEALNFERLLGAVACFNPCVRFSTGLLLLGHDVAPIVFREVPLAQAARGLVPAMLTQEHMSLRSSAGDLLHGLHIFFGGSAGARPSWLSWHTTHLEK